MKTDRLFWMIVLSIIGALFVAACTPSPPEPPAVQASEAEVAEHTEEELSEAESAEHADDDEHSDEGEDNHPPDDHMAGAHDVPEEAAAVPNPIAANEQSIAAGEQLYATNCAVCHGETGQGDGPGAAGLEKPPANLTAGHVQELRDGALFYIISHGRPDTPMPAWENILSEDERWQVVNFLRTFHTDEASSEHDDDGHENEDDDGN